MHKTIIKYCCQRALRAYRDGLANTLAAETADAGSYLCNDLREAIAEVDREIARLEKT